MSVNVDDFIHPNSDSVHFTKEELIRMEKNAKEAKERLDASVKHIIKADKPIKRKWVPKKEIKRQLEDIDIKLRQLQWITEI